MRPDGALGREWSERLIAQALGPEDFLFVTADGALWLVCRGVTREIAGRTAGATLGRTGVWGLAVSDAVELVSRHEGTTPWEARLRDHLARSGGHAPSRGQVVARDPAMLHLLDTVDRIAPATISVLILGETGVGKDVVAAAVHGRSPRRSAPFLRLNCAALPESLLESELFGHEAGAFTGARALKRGLLESADGGTVFLDEVGDLPAALQAKLLRVLESREVTRVGGVTNRTIDVRFVAATNRRLDEAVRRGGFREDLFYRLAGVILRVPPLRERRAEIVPLALFFAEQLARELGRPDPFRLASATRNAIAAYDWPGNVRELRHAIERAALLSDGPEIEVADLALDLEAPRTEPDGDAPETTAVSERLRIEAALAACAGNQTRAAKLLGIARRTLVKKLSRHGLPRPRAHRSQI
jgi:DNA-binding NtrC family response regulator